MKKLEREVSELRDGVNTTAELRAANYLLQDKVDRQEAFLKRKLEKEKKEVKMKITCCDQDPQLNIYNRI